MKAVILQFPGSNRDADAIMAFSKVSGLEVSCAWQDEDIPSGTDLVVVPGGFSYGDYLRAGAIAARAPIMNTVLSAAKKGIRILGICNGFQILCEAGLLPGVLLHNQSLNFVCKEILLEVTNTTSPFTKLYEANEIIRCPVAHQQGNYYASKEELKKLEGEGLIAFKYANGTNPNGSSLDIAGILSKDGNILGMMPHPENFIEAPQGCSDGRRLLMGSLDIQLDAA